MKAATLTAVGMALAASAGVAARAQNVDRYEGRLDNGATWKVAVPDEWNGTLLL